MQAFFERLPFFGSFFFGLLSFFMPCILPLIPAFISYVTGISIEELKGKKIKIFPVFFPTLFFCLGFSTIFTLLGASATYVGFFINRYAGLFVSLSGIFIFILGLHTVGLLPITWLMRGKSFNMKFTSIKLLASFLIGVGFAAGWTPCTGPILSSILMMAAGSDTVYKGMLLLFCYSVGLSIPFLVVSVTINKFIDIFDVIKKYLNIIKITSGAVLMCIGIIMVTGKFVDFSTWFSSLFN